MFFYCTLLTFFFSSSFPSFLTLPPPSRSFFLTQSLLLVWIPWVSIHIFLSDDLMFPPLCLTSSLHIKPVFVSPLLVPTAISCNLSLTPLPLPIFLNIQLISSFFICLYLLLHFPFLILLNWVLFCTSWSFSFIVFTTFTSRSLS